MTDDQGAKAIARHAAIETGGALAGGLVGLVIGGPPGAVVGAASAPPLTASIRLMASAARRRLRRAESLVDEAIQLSGLSSEEFEATVEADEGINDLFLSTLVSALQGPADLERAYVPLLTELGLSPDELRIDRIRLMVQSIGNLDRTQVRIVILLANSHEAMAPRHISAELGIPEKELRRSVRDLEMRGIIKDTGQDHPLWQIRSLGRSIVEAIKSQDDVS